MIRIIYLFGLLLLGTSAFSQVADTYENIKPLAIGETVPNVGLFNLNNNSENTIDIVKTQKSIFIFYRGGWCPYCNVHLAAVGESKKDINELGYKIIGITTDSPEELNKTADKNNLDYKLYSDKNGAFMKAMGIAYEAPKMKHSKLLKYSNNTNEGVMPVPSLFVVDNNGQILYEYISEDYKTRISSDELINVLKGL